MDKVPLYRRGLQNYWRNFTGLESEDENGIFNDDSLNQRPNEPASDDDNEDKRDGTTSKHVCDIPVPASENLTKSKQIASTIRKKKKHMKLNEELQRL